MLDTLLTEAHAKLLYKESHGLAFGMVPLKNWLLLLCFLLEFGIRLLLLGSTRFSP